MFLTCMLLIFLGYSLLPFLYILSFIYIYLFNIFFWVKTITINELKLSWIVDSAFPQCSKKGNTGLLALLLLYVFFLLFIYFFLSVFSIFFFCQGFPFLTIYWFLMKKSLFLVILLLLIFCCSVISEKKKNRIASADESLYDRIVYTRGTASLRSNLFWKP